MYKDKRALTATLRKYETHILGSLFTEAADTIDGLLDEVDRLKARIAELENGKGEAQK